MIRLISLFFAASLSLQAVEPTNFIRITETEERAQLQTAVTTYTKGESSVTLIGAIHIADEAYFQSLNKEFSNYPTLLFELIGGEDVAQTLDGKPDLEEREDDGRPTSGLSGLYGSLAKLMQLVEQLEYIDYTKENFVHGDLTMEEHDKLTEGKDIDILAFSLQTSAKTSEITGKAFGGMDMGLVTRALLSGDGSLLKLQYMKLMDQGDESAAALTGKNLIIGDRNDKCFQVLAKHQKEGAKKIGIFYGAAHFPDMEKRLLADGFERTEHRWLTAWDIKKTMPKSKE